MSIQAYNSNVKLVNPILLEILQRYKDMGVWNESELTFEIGNSGDLQHPNCAFTADTGDFSEDAPRTIGQVLETLIDVFEDFTIDREDEIDEQLFKQMIAELKDKRQVIDSAWEYVTWEVGETGYQIAVGNSDRIYKGLTNSWETFSYTPKSGDEFVLRKEGNQFGPVLEYCRYVNGVLVEGTEVE